MVAETGGVAWPAAQVGWERAIARVVAQSGEPTGAAFLVSDGLMLTCSQVVAEILGQPPEERLPAGTEVAVDFPLSADRNRVTARVEFSMPVAQNGTGDIAVLRLAGSAPPDAIPLRLLAADDLADHRWRAFGFPLYRTNREAKDEGIWTAGTIRGREGTGWWQLSIDPEEAFTLTGGFSGAPVWDDDYTGVVGIVVAVEKDVGRRTGYALTMESVAREWPELRSQLLAGCPYRALLPFTELDADVFFGRSVETDRLAELVMVENHPIIPVLGPSGVGKSSLVGAGLLARLAESGGYLVGKIPHGIRHNARELLAWALSSTGRDIRHDAAWHAEWRALAASLAADESPTEAADRILADQPEGTRLIIVVDQFESLLSSAPDTALELDAMLGELTRRGPDGTRRVQAIVIARIDFLRQLEVFPHITEAWKTTNVVIPPLTRDQLRQVVSAPIAGLRGIRFAVGLEEQILHDTPPGPAALPMLEYTLAELWKRQERGIISTAAYRELGGVDGALARNAERALAERSDRSELKAAERVLIQMVRPGEQLDAGGRAPDARRVANRDEFDAAHWNLIHRLASSRLVVITRQPTGPDTTELAHEVLIDAWPRLAGWVEANREFRTWQEGLRRAIRQWQDRDEDPRELLQEPQITDARHWEHQRAAELTQAERQFIEASDEAAARHRRRRRWQFGAGALAVLVAIGAGVIAVQQYRNGQVQQKNSLSQQLVAEAAGVAANQPNLAKQLDVAAYDLAPTSQAYSALFSGLRLSGTIAAPGVTNAEFSPSGGLLAVSAGAQVQLWNRATQAVEATVPAAGGANGTAFEGNGKVMAVAEGSGKIQLWNLSRPQHPVPAGSVTGPGVVSQVVFSRGGLLGAAGWDHTVRLWNVADTARPLLLSVIPAGVQQASALAFSPDGRMLATADWDGSFRLWNIDDPNRPTRYGAIGKMSTARFVAFSSSGVLATAGEALGTIGDAVRLWRIDDPRSPRLATTLSSRAGPLSSVAFSPAAPLLAVTGPGMQGASLWNTSDPGHPAPLPSLFNGGLTLSFSPDGQTLAMLGQDVQNTRGAPDEVELRNISVPQNPATFAALHIAAGPSVVFSPDARRMALAGNYTQIWSLSRPEDPALTGEAHTGQASNIAMTAVGHRLLLTTGSGGVVVLWDVTARPFPVNGFRIGPREYTDNLINTAFSSDGTMLAALDSDYGIIGRWSLADPGHIVRLPSLTGATPDGQISVGAKGTIITDTDGADVRQDGAPPSTTVWDLRTGSLRPIARLNPLAGNAVAADVDPVGSVIATRAVSGEIRLWRIADAGQLSLLDTLPDTTAPQYAPESTMAFSPDGQILASIDENATVHVWNVADPGDPRAIGTFTAPNQSDLVGVSLPVNASTGHLVETENGNGITQTGNDIGLWGTNPSGLIHRICAAAGDPVSNGQWKIYAHGQPNPSPCQAGG